ncbi:MAG: ATP-dependent helicase HrpB [Nitrospira sp.]|jgi:ATP-dependent helicase HrpB|nr:MAG: ATP-dependent helicase HrpB [Nitrospira sp.]
MLGENQTHPTMDRLPIEEVFPALRGALTAGRSTLLTAQPGAGKTTRVPLALLQEPWLAEQKLVLLEPRRLAARAAAGYMAASLREPVGRTVGYRIRHDTKVGPDTRIEVVTEGILTRMLQQDPSLEGYGLVIFDEFHERSLQADLGLAFARESQRLFRPDLRLLVMSATLDCAAVTRILHDAEIVSCEGRLHPVTTHYLDRPIDGRLEQAVVRSIRQALARDIGSLLVFLPGMAEIRRTERHLREVALGSDILIAPLHGDLPQDEQEQAILPAPSGRRKIVLATSIAETSLTIEGVRVVIDAGLMRVPRFDPRSGLTRLDTIRVTQDAADQRRGRAGRSEPGTCYRLWTEAEQQALLPRRPPEILEADLAPLALDLAEWGVIDERELSWLDPPPTGSLAQARELLRQLGALDEQGTLTAHGRRLAHVTVHPRLAHMIVTAVSLGWGPSACNLAGLLSERDILQGGPGWRNADLRVRVEALQGTRDQLAGATVNRAACDRVRRASEQWRRQLHLASSSDDDHEHLGILLAFAYPDRIAQRITGSDGRYRLSNGRGASFHTVQSLSQDEYLVVAQLDGSGEWARILLAAPASIEAIQQYCAERIHSVDLLEWDERSETVRARRQRRLGQLVLDDRALHDPDQTQVVAALTFGIRRAGLTCLPWTKELQQWRARISFLHRIDPAWPDLSDEALLPDLERWLGPFLTGLTSLAQVRRLDLMPPLDSLLTRPQRQELDRLAPTHLIVPSGSRVRVDYEQGEVPVLAVRLQELFGCRETPLIAGGKVPVMVHLLSPAGRPVQVTKDLASFWCSAYQEVKKELRGRYPRHHWPDDPLAAQPTNRTKRRA